MDAQELGRYLRARRGQVTPQQIGFPPGGRRRVAGLRREEVAIEAGLSVDCYTRLEQGRERHPSAQVLEALAGALHLDADGRDHVFRLARLTPPLDPATRSSRADALLLQLMAKWTETPATILNRQLDVLARNELAEALHSEFALRDNVARMTFLDPAGRHFYADWPRAAAAAVGSLRLAEGIDAASPSLRGLVDDLSSDPEFERLWSQQRVRGKSHEPKTLVHPDVGRLDLQLHSFDVRGAPGQQLVVYQAASGSRSEDGLRLLGSLHAGSPGSV